MSVLLTKAGPGEISIEAYGSKAYYLAQIARQVIATPPAVAIASGVSFSTQVIQEAIDQLQLDTGYSLGDQDKPLVVSVRSSPMHPLAGVTGAILNLGMDRKTLQYRIQAGDSVRTLFDCYSQLLEDVGGLDGISEQLRDELDGTLYEGSVSVRRRLSDEAFETLSSRYESVFHKNGIPLPEASVEYLTTIAFKVARTFDSEICRRFRFDRRIADESMGLVIQKMVYGNADDRSATIACFSRNATNGMKQLYGECLAQAQGSQWSEQDPHPVETLRDSDPGLYDELYQACSVLERVGKTHMDCEFTVESGRLFCLQARPGSAAPLGNIQISCDLVREGILEPLEAAQRVSAQDIETVLQPQLDRDSIDFQDIILRAMGASEGAAIGRIALTVESAQRMQDDGVPYVFVLTDVNTREEARLASQSTGLVVTADGMLSEAAVIARHFQVPCVARAVDVDIIEGELCSPHGRVVEGDWVTIDGDEGLLMANRQPLFYPEPSPEIKQLLEWKRNFGIS